MNGPLLAEVRKLAEDITTREGCYLYDLEFVGAGSGRTLRVYIDKTGDGGASIEDCTKVTRGLNEILDTQDIIPGGEYNLEVSTPGLERVLKEPRHYDQAIGKKISVKTFAPLVDFNKDFPELGKAKTLQGTLRSYDESKLVLEYQEREVFVPFDSVTKAHVVFEFVDSSQKPGQKKPGSKKKKDKAKS